MTDGQRLDWLSKHSFCIPDVQERMQSMGEDIRTAVDYLADAYVRAVAQAVGPGVMEAIAKFPVIGGTFTTSEVVADRDLFVVRPKP